MAALVLPVLIGRTGDHALGRLNRHESLHQWVVVEEVTHGLLGAAVCLPLFWSRRRAWYLIIPVLLATAIDFDHYAAARARLPELTSDEMPDDMVELLSTGVRSPVHSITFALASAAGVLLLSRRLDWAWVVLASLTSHLLRDAYFAPITFWWPTTEGSQIDHRSYLFAESALALMSVGVFLVYRPANALIRRMLTSSVGLVVPQRPPPDWQDGAPVAPVSRTRRSHHRSRRRPSRQSPSHVRPDRGHSHHHHRSA